MLEKGGTDNKRPTAYFTRLRIAQELSFLLKYVAIGVVNTAVGLGTIFLLLFLGANAYIANVAGYGIGLGVSYFLNRTFNFRCSLPVKKTFPRFLVVVAVAYGVNVAVLKVSLDYFSLNKYAAQVFAVGFYTIVGFVGHRWATFSPASGRTIGLEGKDKWKSFYMPR